MSGLPNDPRLPSEAPALTPELRDYVLACLRAARPSRLRTQAIDAFARAMPAPPTAPPIPVDWEELEREAVRRGITLAELIAEQGSDDLGPSSEPGPFSI
jgi:hypothetical protein